MWQYEAKDRHMHILPSFLCIAIVIKIEKDWYTLIEQSTFKFLLRNIMAVTNSIGLYS